MSSGAGACNCCAMSGAVGRRARPPVRVRARDVRPSADLALLQRLANTPAHAFQATTGADLRRFFAFVSVLTTDAF